MRQRTCGPSVRVFSYVSMAARGQMFNVVYKYDIKIQTNRLFKHIHNHNTNSSSKHFPPSSLSSPFLKFTWAVRGRVWIHSVLINGGLNLRVDRISYHAGLKCRLCPPLQLNNLYILQHLKVLSYSRKTLLLWEEKHNARLTAHLKVLTVSYTFSMDGYTSVDIVPPNGWISNLVLLHKIVRIVCLYQKVND